MRWSSCSFSRRRLLSTDPLSKDLGDKLADRLAFFPMFLMHLFGAMGAGDVKLFGAVGAVLGVGMVPMAFVVVVMVGAALAVYSMLRSGTVFSTLHGVLRIVVGILPGWEMPRFAMPADRRHTIPYGVAIMIGSVLATVFFRG